MTEEPMTKLASLSAAALLVLVAACNPADSVPFAIAQPQPAAVALYPDVAPGAGDGHVHEYH
jgi:hypothetical protein